MFQRDDITAPLQFLDLSWVHSLTRDGVTAIANISTLEEVVLTGIENVSGRTLRAFTTAEVRLSLTSINLSYCPLRDAALFELFASAPNLKKLTLAESSGNLWATGNFSTAGIEELRRMYPRVQIAFVT